MPNTIKTLDPKLLVRVTGGLPATPKTDQPPSCPPWPSEPTKPWPPANWA